MPTKRVILCVLVCFVLYETLSYYGMNFKRVKLSQSQENIKYMKVTPRNLSNCIVMREDLHGREQVNTTFPYKEDDLVGKTELGGRWKPKDCLADKRVAIIIPFKNRHAHLKVLLPNLIPKLRRQKVDYTFYIVEQAVNGTFNTGMMKNVGFTIARQEADFDCYIFQDVDTIIENDFNMYTCSRGTARHIGVLRSKHNYIYSSDAYFGGIVSFPGDLFAKVNGYTNLLFTWGKEDDALYIKIGRKVERPPRNVSHVTTLWHKREEEYKETTSAGVFKLMMDFWKEDGLNSLNYTSVIKKEKLFTWVKVYFDKSFYEQMLENFSKRKSSRK